ncbi:MAG TPA: hypothetical protein VFA53_11150 [Xanthobacteraceae bacterium]|nr:hypothetical protein [Xanthobacteraceae bacterium]
MSLWRFLFPTFERPVAQRRYLQLEPRRRHSSGIAVVVGLSAVCGAIFLALPAAPQRPIATPHFLLAEPLTAQPDAEATLETDQASADANGDISLQQLSALCNGDRPTARRVCVEAKAARDAKLEQVTEQAKAQAKAEENAALAAKIAADARAKAALASAQTPQSSQAPAKTKTALDTEKRTADNIDKGPVETLVHVYDQVTPDGRIVPVYRSSNGGYRFGAPQGSSEERRAELQQPRSFFSFFGMR